MLLVVQKQMTKLSITETKIRPILANQSFEICMNKIYKIKIW